MAHCLDQMLKSSPTVYDLLTDTMGIAYWFNVLTLLACHSMWSVEDVQNYLRTSSKDRKKWVIPANPENAPPKLP